MFVKILGFLDVFSALVLVVESRTSFFPSFVVFYAALYLIFKGVLFWKSVTSWIDAFIGFLLFLFSFFKFPSLGLIAGAHLFVKGLVSFI